ncbi:prolyl oligopeptidase family serine peptidase [Acetobacteraceae bacterium KSS8]|uniref:Prolyl oligopeptidase family serine peptidase n=1 Tax=Endosaccharibacter trunci TaxID=2812733 RepID=A0ABT1W5Q5_9PROT|nr:prolyl oligopeptidase family serine peptidase [Acetobacteraceae bacterium KSS8]
MPQAMPKAPEDCFAQLAATRSDTLGMPVHAVPTPDGRSVLFLRSGPRDTTLHLFRFDVANGAVTELAKPAGGPETLSVAEKARRERARMTLTGITDFSLSEDGRTLLAIEADHLLRIDPATGRRHQVPGSGWIGPRLSPDGRFVAAVRDNDLHVVSLTDGADTRLTRTGSDTLSNGLSEFAAAEELDRADGAWWSPDSRTVLFEVADTSGVEKHFIADPGHPDRAPVEFRYPRAGTANARLSLMLADRDGRRPPRPVKWDSEAFPYLVRVVWPTGKGRLSLVVMNRAETEERVLAVDPGTGNTTELLRETDPAWVAIAPVAAGTRAGQALPLPHWFADGSGFLWAAETKKGWELQRRRPDGSLERRYDKAAFLGLEAADPHHAVILTEPDRIDTAVERLDLDTGAVTPLSAAPGLHEGRFAPGNGTDRPFVDVRAGADGNAATVLLDPTGRVIATLPSVAEHPRSVHIEFTQAGPAQMDALIVRPSDFQPGRHYPVVLQVYAGPGVKTVERAPSHFLEDQCLADRGFIVASLDGRGTPGRDHDWERATKDDLIDLPLADQADGLKALGARYPEMDMSRVGVTGWSFGGYFTAMATIRRPDLFKVGVAGAPVVDFRDYDTAYTERYLGTPQADPDGYTKSDVLTYAASLSRPLLIMHGLTDDNVYFENSYKLTQALLQAGKPYRLLLLPGTHLLPDLAIRTRVSEARADFLSEALDPGKGG